MVTDKINAFSVTNKIIDNPDPTKPDIMTYISNVEEITSWTYSKVCGSTTNSSYSKTIKETKFKSSSLPEKIGCDSKSKQKLPQSRKNYIAYLKENLKKNREAEKKVVLKDHNALSKFLNLILEENEEFREKNIRRFISNDKISAEKKRKAEDPSTTTAVQKIANCTKSLFSPIVSFEEKGARHSLKNKKQKFHSSSLGSFESEFHQTPFGKKSLNSQHLCEVDVSQLEIADIEDERFTSKKVLCKPYIYKPITYDKAGKKASYQEAAFPASNKQSKPNATKFTSNSTFISLRNSCDMQSKEYQLNISSSSEEDKKKLRSSNSNYKMISTSILNTIASNKKKLGVLPTTTIQSVNDSIVSKTPIVSNFKSTQSVTANLGFPKGKVGAPMLNTSNEIISKCNSAYQNSLLIKEDIVESDKKVTLDDKIINFKENLKLSIGKRFFVMNEAKTLHKNHPQNEIKNSSTFVYNNKSQSMKKRFVSTDDANMLTKSEAINTINSINAYKYKNYLQGKFKVGLDKEDVFGLTNERLALNIKDKIIIDPQKLCIPSNNLFTKVDEALEEGIKRMSKIQSKYLNNQY